MTLTVTVLLVLALYLVQIFLQETTRYRFNLTAIVGNRDARPPMSVVAGRLDRAKNNMLEALALFLPLALMALDKGVGPAALPGALIFLAARTLYIPAYLSGLPWLRSLIWLGANAGLLLMVPPLL